MGSASLGSSCGVVSRVATTVGAMPGPSNSNPPGPYWPPPPRLVAAAWVPDLELIAMDP
jgi:hypothetical protein